MFNSSIVYFNDIRVGKTFGNLVRFRSELSTEKWVLFGSRNRCLSHCSCHAFSLIEFQSVKPIESSILWHKYRWLCCVVPFTSQSTLVLESGPHLENRPSVAQTLMNRKQKTYKSSANITTNTTNDGLYRRKQIPRLWIYCNIVFTIYTFCGPQRIFSKFQGFH